MKPNLRAFEAFSAKYGEEPSGVWSSPGRVNLIGEHTDYNDGFVLPFATPHRTATAARLRTDRVLHIYSADLNESVAISWDELRPETVSGWSAYPLGVAWAFTEFGIDTSSLRGVNLAIASTVPMGAGLSSSAALETSVALALSNLYELDLDRPTLARICQKAENVAAGANTGIMDQMASLLSTAGHVIKLDCRSLEHTLIRCDAETFGLSFVIMDTNTRHSHAGGEYGARRASCEVAASAAGVTALRDLSIGDLKLLKTQVGNETFRRARHVVTENERVHRAARALNQLDFVELGEILTQSHQSMRDDFEISTAELDLQVDVALGAGALGARMTGGGFGGSAIALIATDLLTKLGTVSREKCLELGMPAPTLTNVTPSAGAAAHTM